MSNTPHPDWDDGILVSFRVPPATVEFFRREAMREGVTVVALLGGIIERHYAEKYAYLSRVAVPEVPA